MRFIYILPFIIFLCLSVVFSLKLSTNKTSSYLPSVLLDQPIPSFNLPDLPGRGRPLSSDNLRGKTSLINIFGSWCRTCLVEHPFLIKIKDLIPIHGIDWRDSPEEGERWLAHYGDPYDRVGLDLDSQVAVSLGITGAPETFLIDKNGIIRYKHIGPLSQEVWEKVIFPMVKQLDPQ